MIWTKKSVKKRHSAADRYLPKKRKSKRELITVVFSIVSLAHAPF